ncbi:MAG TPA: TolC family protein [Polaromonas sp.]|uniref:TolC family protein n=1 Tax=Polaromonas sp. TaxID=1869339 RepID=UPI002D6A86C8|nr:TolC family protein [Polaromonas sp.]HYW58205.1 TolC family protein [Polaromonas sp.]
MKSRVSGFNIRPVRFAVWLCALGMFASVQALAQVEKPLTLKEATQKAVLNNPEVMARWHTLNAASNERDVGFGAQLPKVDLVAGQGTERRNDAALRSRYERTSSSLTLTQLLYDGFATRNEVKRLDHARMVRLFEFFDISETVAFEAARAYYDVLRFRELVRLAEENFIQHRAVFEQTERRVKARVARAVDLEQISARVALAESNLLTETSNLHDTTARFQRIVGAMPTVEMPLPTPLAQDIPADAVSAIKLSQYRNAALRASIENVRASNAALASRSGAYQPRFDLRFRRDQGKNLSGIPGTTENNVAEVVMTWNLFNGFSDRARERQFAEQLNVAKDLRDKSCRDIRQTLLIAYNDVRKLKEQIGYLDQNKVAIEKSRNAYRLQFDIGQRSLLDLLDTENELFQSKRAVANAEIDLDAAYVRVHAAQGTLLTALELSRMDTGAVPGIEQWNEGEDASQHCPAEPVALYVVDKAALVGRASDLVKQTALLNARERAIQEVLAPGVTVAAPGDPASPALVTPAPATTPSPAASPASAAMPPAPATSAPRGAPRIAPTPGASLAPAPAQLPDSVSAGELRQTLEAWRAAWAKRDIDGYFGFYAPTFVPSTGGDREAWKERRKRVMERATDVSVEVSDLTLTQPDRNRATTVFKQTYRSSNYRDVVTKTLEWMRVGDRWMITRESSVTPAQGME